MRGRRERRFQSIYDANYELILGYALRRTGSMDDAADVTSETFVVAWRRLDDVPEGERARLWLYGTARRVLANHHRGVRRRRHLNDRLASLTPQPIVEPAAASEHPDASAIGAAFARLSDSDRDLLLLVGWEGMDNGEIAGIVGCSRAALRVRLHRARRRFARELDKEGVKRSEASGHEPGRWAAARPGMEETL